MSTLDYPYIRAWGRTLGSTSGYIEAEVKTARETGAPQHAIFRRFGTRPIWDGKTWATFDTVVDADTWDRMQKTLRDFGVRIPDFERREEFVRSLQAERQQAQSLHL